MATACEILGDADVLTDWIRAFHMMPEWSGASKIPGVRELLAYDTRRFRSKLEGRMQLLHHHSRHPFSHEMTGSARPTFHL